MLRNYPFAASLIALGSGLAVGSMTVNGVYNFLTR